MMIAIIIIGFLHKEAWLEMIKAGGSYSVAFSILLMAACAFFPVVPFAITAGMNGAVFGIGSGLMITLSGSMLGTMLLFFLSRYGFRDWARKRPQNSRKSVSMKAILTRMPLPPCLRAG